MLIYSTGLDIVDMLMNDAVGRDPVSLPAIHRYAYTSKPTYTLNGTSIATKEPAITPETANVSRSRATELRIAKRNLECSYAIEQTVRSTSPCSPQRMAEAAGHRARVERRYVNTLIRYLRNAKRMSATEAARLMQRFTRERMAGLGPVNRTYLLGLYPSELM